MAGLFPLSRQQVFRNGATVGGARLFLFDGGTTTPRTGYRDLALTTEHPNPIVADSDGRLPLIYLDDGYYRQRLTTATGTLIFDDDGLPVVTTSAGGSGTSVDPDSVFKTRDVKIRFDDQPLSGYVRLNGRTIGSASSGATERANADTQSLYEELWGFANISVSGGKGGSAAADFAANKSLVLPDMAGRLLAGMSDLGAGDPGRLTTAILGTDPTEPGAAGGSQTATIAASNLPVAAPWSASAGGISVTGGTSPAGAHSHTGTTDSGGVLNHTHSETTRSNLTNISNGGGAATLNLWQGDSTTNTGGPSAEAHTHTFTTGSVANHDHTVVATGAGPTITMGTNSGGGQAFTKLPPLMTFMIYIRL